MNVQFPSHSWNIWLPQYWQLSACGKYCGVGNVCHAGLVDENRCVHHPVFCMPTPPGVCSSAVMFYWPIRFVRHNDPSSIGVFGLSGHIPSWQPRLWCLLLHSVRRYVKAPFLSIWLFKPFRWRWKDLYSEGRFIFLVIISRIACLLFSYTNPFDIFKWFVLAVELDRCIEYDGNGFYGLSWFW